MLKVFKEMFKYKFSLLMVVLSVLGAVWGTLQLPTYMADIINKGIGGKDMALIWQTGGMMLLFTAVSMFSSLLTGYFSARIATGVGRALRSQVFARVEGFSTGEINAFSTASLITRTNNDILQVQTFGMMFLRVVLMSPIMCIGGLTLAFAKSPEMSKVLFVSMPLLLVAVVLIAKNAMPISKAMQKKLDRINLVMQEKLTGLRVIRAFGTEGYEEQKFAVANGDLTATTLKMQRIMALLMPMAMLILNGTTVALVWFGGQGVFANEIMVGDIVAIVQYVMQIMMSVMMLSMIFVMYPRAVASMDRVNEVLNTQPLIEDKAETKDNPLQKGCLEFKDVTFSFPDSDEPALKHISFVAKPGETTAIIGSTGSGKSALINLIPRFFDVRAGAVLVDGVDVRDYSQHILRGKIGYIPQKAFLFSGDIAYNISFGDANITDEKIGEALKIAQATDFVAAKKYGIHSQISQGGTNLSGGQKQRLSIARAIAKKPEIYIFDDSFSALDFKTDAALRQALNQKIRQDMAATVLIVAQRISTIMDANQIIVLDDGEMVGIGTHKQLFESCKTYQEIVYSQLSKEEMN